MTQEQKELLLKDLCARLPHRPKIWFAESNSNDNFQSVWYDNLEGWQVDGNNLSAPVYAVKPYLFPLSGMTNEQRKELYKIGWYLALDKIYSRSKNYDGPNYKTHIDCLELINWCYENHFDINGLIPMGLAIDARDKNIY